MTRPDGLHLLTSIADIAAPDWDALLDATTAAAAPCLRHAYLASLEEAACVGGHSGWTPAHGTLWRDGKAIAAMPLYLKHHSYGEYVFDWAWAEAYARHGLAYYPKWLSAVPFTPIPGPRLLGSSAAARSALLAAVLAHVGASGHSSFHLLFPADEELALLRSEGMMIREGVQFHWHNRPPGARSLSVSPPASQEAPSHWADFDAFLASLSSEKRKKIRQERRRAAAHGLELHWLDGHTAQPKDWDFLWRCYASTYALHRSTPYLTRPFFHLLAERMPTALRLLIAARRGEPVAAALFLCDEKALYGRYWGALEDLPFLHFELCYYQGIDYAIRRRLRWFDAGAQGEHKIARGFEPVETWSLHWIRERRFAVAIADFLARERAHIQRYVEEARSLLPYRAADGD